MDTSQTISFADQIPVKTPREVLNGAVSFVDKLAIGATLTNPGVVELSGGLTVGTPAVTTEPLLVDGESIPAGQAVTFIMSGGTAAADYRIDVFADDSDSQTLEVYSRLQLATALWETNRAALLENIRHRCELLLNDLRGSHKPSYTINGQAMDWEEYGEGLRAEITWATAEIERENNEGIFEIVSLGR